MTIENNTTTTTLEPDIMAITTAYHDVLSHTDLLLNVLAAIRQMADGEFPAGGPHQIKPGSFLSFLANTAEKEFCTVTGKYEALADAIGTEYII